MNPFEEIKAQLDDDLKKITEAINTSGLVDLRKNTAEAMEKVKANFEEKLQALEKQIEIADWFIDPRIDELRQSKYTFPIVIGAALAVLGLGIFIGMQIY